jgi:hypothetical protein
MKIYVASSWRNLYQQAVVHTLQSHRHQVYDFRNPPDGKGGFAWSDIDPAWEQWTTTKYIAALEHPLAEEGFHRDFQAMHWADLCILVLPCGRSANAEAGWMCGAGKPVYVYQPEKQEPELMYKMHSGIFADFNTLLLNLPKL